LDIDHFKRINDEHGHRTGDDVLRAFAAAVRARLRTSDVFGRIGGEEFGVVLPAADAAGATRLAEEVRAAVAALQLHSRRGALVSVTASVGVCTVCGDPSLTEDEFFARADRALYAVKRSGRDGVAHSDEVPALQAG
ncbi:MAG TPA: GGDEF domain-containing protein, partial [Albitalea sp.]|nr:GGDEF domain-containing protein [Albitalea sp.]